MIHSEKFNAVQRGVANGGLRAVIGHAIPVGLTYITRGLLDVQIPLEPRKLVLSMGYTLPSLYFPMGVN